MPHGAREAALADLGARDAREPRARRAARVGQSAAHAAAAALVDRPQRDRDAEHAARLRKRRGARRGGRAPGLEARAGQRLAQDPVAVAVARVVAALGGGLVGVVGAGVAPGAWAA